jgi:hypothetical protein
MPRALISCALPATRGWLPSPSLPDTRKDTIMEFETTLGEALEQAGQDNYGKAYGMGALPIEWVLKEEHDRLLKHVHVEVDGELRHLIGYLSNGTIGVLMTLKPMPPIRVAY